MEITITKTIQVQQYEPITVSVKEQAEVHSNEQYEKLKNKVSACVEDIIVNEVTKYSNSQFKHN